MRTKSQNGSRSRSKGVAWENEVARLFAKRFPDSDVRRCLAQSRTAKREGCDVEGTPWYVECKVGARGTVRLHAALEQAEKDSDGRWALVVAKEDRMEPVVYCRLQAIASSKWGTENVPVQMTLASFMAFLGVAR